MPVDYEPISVRFDGFSMARVTAMQGARALLHGLWRNWCPHQQYLAEGT